MSNCNLQQSCAFLLSLTNTFSSSHMPLTCFIKYSHDLFRTNTLRSVITPVHIPYLNMVAQVQDRTLHNLANPFSWDIACLKQDDIFTVSLCNLQSILYIAINPQQSIACIGSIKDFAYIDVHKIRKLYAHTDYSFHSISYIVCNLKYIHIHNMTTTSVIFCYSQFSQPTNIP